MSHLTPAEYAIHCFGSAYALAAAISCGRNAPLRWCEAGKTRKGTGKCGPKSRKPGDIPMPAVRQILAAAKERGLPITTDDLIYGRDVADAPRAPSSSGVPAAVG